MPHVFTYGSLMFDRVWDLVVEGQYDKSTATLPGYTRKAVVAEEFPAIFSHPASSEVVGILYFDVSETDLNRLDKFEGRLYTRKQEQVLLDSTTPLLAEVYVVKNRYRHIISENDWDPVHFETTGIKKFVKNYLGFNRSA